MTVHNEASTGPGKGKSTEALDTSNTVAVLEHNPIGLQRALFFRQLRLMKASVTMQGGEQK